MVAEQSFRPRQYPGVMVSSTFRDLQQHRAALIKALQDQQMLPVVMESDSALPDGTVIDSSLRKVRDATAYIDLAQPSLRPGSSFKALSRTFVAD